MANQVAVFDVETARRVLSVARQFRPDVPNLGGVNVQNPLNGAMFAQITGNDVFNGAVIHFWKEVRLDNSWNWVDVPEDNKGRTSDSTGWAAIATNQSVIADDTIVLLVPFETVNATTGAREIVAAALVICCDDAPQYQGMVHSGVAANQSGWQYVTAVNFVG